MANIVPKSKAKGVDFCGSSYYYYIIRSDLGCYLQSSDFSKGSDLTIFNLHPSCQNGDHYLANKDGNFYIIKGKFYRKVTDLSRDDSAVIASLHPNCQGGDNYLAAFGFFYIIFKERGVYRKTSDLSLDSNAVEYKLHPNCSNGLYYWGLPDNYYFLKPDSQGGVEYYKGSNFNKDQCVAVYSVHPDVVNFLPGGLSITKGPTFGRWQKIKHISNNSTTPVTRNEKVTKEVGYSKEKMTRITHNWKMNGSSLSLEPGDLTSLITKYQFSLSTEYGGLRVNTEKERWDEVTKVEEGLTFELKPGESLNLWQYQLGFCDEAVLFCCDLKINDVSDSPN